MYEYHMFGGYGFNWLGLVFDIVFWALIIWLILVVIHRLSHHEGSEFCCNKKQISGTASSAALNILKERYAKGEISKEQFETMKHDIES